MDFQLPALYQPLDGRFSLFSPDDMGDPGPVPQPRMRIELELMLPNELTKMTMNSGSLSPHTTTDPIPAISDPQNDDQLPDETPVNPSPAQKTQQPATSFFRDANTNGTKKNLQPLLLHPAYFAQNLRWFVPLPNRPATQPVSIPNKPVRTSQQQPIRDSWANLPPHISITPVGYTQGSLYVVSGLNTKAIKVIFTGNEFPTGNWFASAVLEPAVDVSSTPKLYFRSQLRTKGNETTIPIKTKSTKLSFQCPKISSFDKAFAANLKLTIQIHNEKETYHHVTCGIRLVNQHNKAIANKKIKLQERGLGHLSMFPYAL